MNEWLEAEQRVERAIQLSEAERWEDALREIEAALAINPNNAMWHAHHGFLLDELERYNDCVDAYRQALALEPASIDVAMALGTALIRLERYAAALEVLEEVARLDPDFEPAYCHRIRVYVALGDHERAEEMFYRAQALNDACPHCFFFIAGSLAARGENERAIYCWQRVLALEPAYLGVNERIGQAYRSMGRPGEAREYLLAELRDDPGNTDLLFELAELALESGDVVGAGARFTQILELEPDHAAAQYALGKLWLRKGDPAKALSCLEAAREMTDVALPHYDASVGDALLRLARLTEARRHLESAVREDPDGAWVNMLLGNCLLGLGRSDGAADGYRRVLALTSDRPFDNALRPEAHLNLAVCLFRDGRYASGLEHCLEAVRLQPNNTVAMYRAALAQARLARWRDARAMLARALRTAPDDESVRQLSRRLWRYRLGRAVRRLLAPRQWFRRQVDQ
ncbi:MAG: tetratricopeptide repeat protein [Phycisphaerae bacterium]